MIYIMELSHIQDQKITNYAIGAEHSAVTVQEKRIKEEKSSCLAGICQ